MKASVWFAFLHLLMLFASVIAIIRIDYYYMVVFLLFSVLFLTMFLYLDSVESNWKEVSGR